MCADLHEPGATFSDGKLCIFTETEIMVIRGWPVTQFEYGSHLSIALSRYKVVRDGLTFTIDRATGSITRNDRQLGSFGDIETVQLRTIHDSESADEYRLSLVTKDQQKLFLGQTSDRDTIMAAADEIADLIDVPIHKK